jgi:hypothetical protein
MQHSPFRIRGSLFALGVMVVCLGAGLACPGNLSPEFTNQTTGVAGSTGAAGMGAGGSGSFPSCSIEPLTLIKNKCGLAGCHVANNTNAGGLDLNSDGVASRLVGVQTTGDNASECGGMTYLIAGSSPAMGLFIDKLTDPPPCGVKMPNLGSWNDTNTQCLTQWATSVTAP